MSKRKRPHGESAFFISGENFLKEQISAREAIWDGKIWVLHDVRRYHVETGEMEKIERMEYAGLESPDLFHERVEDPRRDGNL